MKVFLGQRAWLVQRASALTLLLLVALGAALLLLGPALNHERWHALATSAHGAVIIVLFFAALSLHGWVGARDIVLDYVPSTAARLSVLSIVAAILFAVVIRVALTMAAHLSPVS
ncbi:MAG: succinate dehydrogenase, hydrophobic membrane anchor protein [Polaromonas sp.]|uniref:succinate dehydrogenase, hydrophobic membrane anchor protein n=1 Tax=Betaproteobacteria TaxID=28216 RepID=UPI0027370707|nr:MULTISPECIES: succinate dehydrogenase, hydrophobic membrane anchor protein [Betaproteobacteria]MDP2867395.1 succinate dehydrogenase, hydrophobic membrane anchor protein [Methyloversatilis sp.]MDP3246011.1 succinate dehydrogenase, hydrophobic membrane anchor protein [Polaromonas sp.]MDP3456851.1 succinate dehydrogenase, hydrophobic membrane anchor protein [Methyloversatilis sp.]MDP3580139.1 succinate dehydrogenase, hydrophobic membrane anchor protein [Methyloversatilis sp.]